MRRRFRSFCYPGVIYHSVLNNERGHAKYRGFVEVSRILNEITLRVTLNVGQIDTCIAASDARVVK